MINPILTHILAALFGGLSVYIYHLAKEIKIKEIKPSDAEFIIKKLKLFEDE